MIWVDPLHSFLWLDLAKVVGLGMMANIVHALAPQTYGHIEVVMNMFESC